MLGPALSAWASGLQGGGMGVGVGGCGMSRVAWAPSEGGDVGEGADPAPPLFASALAPDRRALLESLLRSEMLRKWELVCAKRDGLGCWVARPHDLSLPKTFPCPSLGPSLRPPGLLVSCWTCAVDKHCSCRSCLKQCQG